VVIGFEDGNGDGIFLIIYGCVFERCIIFQLSIIVTQFERSISIYPIIKNCRQNVK